jgi:hypothetical protein
MKNLFDEIFKVKIQGCDETYFFAKIPFFLLKFANNGKRSGEEVNQS